MAVNSIPRTLVLFRQYAETEVRFKDGPLLAVIREVLPQDQLDARRLVACWNACEGLATEQLERCGTLDRASVSRDVAIQRHIESLTAQRNEMLAELEKIATSVDIDTLREAIDCARNAIAKATGGPP